MRRTKKLTRRRTRRSSHYHYGIGCYVQINKRRYRKLLRFLDCGRFHTTEGAWGFTVKVINERVREALIKTEKYG